MESQKVIGTRMIRKTKKLVLLHIRDHFNGKTFSMFVYWITALIGKNKLLRRIERDWKENLFYVNKSRIKKKKDIAHKYNNEGNGKMEKRKLRRRRRRRRRGRGKNISRISLDTLVCSLEIHCQTSSTVLPFSSRHFTSLHANPNSAPLRHFDIPYNATTLIAPKHTLLSTPLSSTPSMHVTPPSRHTPSAIISSSSSYGVVQILYE